MENHQHEEHTLFKQDDGQRTITGMTPLKPSTNSRPTHISDQMFLPSTLPYTLAKESLNFRSVYQLHSKILQKTSITETMRAVKVFLFQRLRSFIMNQGKKQVFYRQICTLACTYIDLYFLKNGCVQISQFQHLVIACLIIACKSRQSYLPKISYDVFNKQQLLKFQEKIILTLSFNLNPPTYYQYAQRIVFIWDHYVESKKMYDLKFSEQKQGVNYKLRRFYEQLDYVYMVLSSLDYDIEKIVMNLFYLHARMLNVYEVQSPEKLSNKQFCQFFYPKNDLFIDFFLKFIFAQFKQSSFQLNPSIGYYLKHFLAIQPEKRQWELNSNEQIHQKIRVWDCIQTLPKNCYKTVKQIISQIKHNL